MSIENESQDEKTPFTEYKADSGETVQVHTDADAMRSVGAGNFTVGETIEMKETKIEIVGVAPMFPEQDFTLHGNRPNPNNMLWVRINGGETIGYFRLKSGETYDDVLQPNI
jgi:hypothetical protein